MSHEGCAVRVNGEMRLVTAESVERMLDELGYPAGTPGIAVALNGEIVPRRRWSDQRLASGDEVEIVEAVQGG